MSGTDYRTPGVYVEEISTFPLSVAEVATAIPAFVGYTEMDLKGGMPTRISSLLEYESQFGKASSMNIELNVTDSTTNPIKIEFPTLGRKPALNSFLYYSLQLFFLNGGATCYIVSVGRDTVVPDRAALKSGLDKLESVDEPTLIIIPDTSRIADDISAMGLMNDILDQCARLQNRFAILDVRTSPEVFRSNITGDPDKAKFGAAYYPDLHSVLSYYFSDDDVTVLSSGSKTLAQLKTTDQILYDGIRAALNAMYVTLPPSGAMAGIYTAVDATRGVWKAPANISVAGVIGPSIQINEQEQEDLNVDVIEGKSINCIREFPGRGTLVWGARTLAGNHNEWKYVPVRRFCIMVEQSLKPATASFVFEPNNLNTWTKVRGLIENYLTVLWRSGALAGAKTQEAFFVGVGLNETMTTQDILEGRLIVEVGLAVTRPAEFIILQFTQKMQTS